MLGLSSLIALKRAIKSGGEKYALSNWNIIEPIIKLAYKKIYTYTGIRIVYYSTILLMITNIILTWINLSWGQIIVFAIEKLFKLKTQYRKALRFSRWKFRKIRVKYVKFG